MKLQTAIALSLGKLEPDPEKIEIYKEKLKKEFPAAIIIVERGCVKATAKGLFDRSNGLHCMKCGGLMNNRANQYVKDGVWIAKKRKGGLSCWECPKCAPLRGGQIIMCVMDDAYRLKQ